LQSQFGRGGEKGILASAWNRTPVAQLVATLLTEPFGPFIKELNRLKDINTKTGPFSATVEDNSRSILGEKKLKIMAQFHYFLQICRLIFSVESETIV